MIVLALDTSSRTGSIALWRDGAIIGVEAGSPLLTHAERLPSALVDAVRSRGLDLARVDIFAVAAGPGSFTGLRVGIATVQGLAFASGRLVVGVSTLDALALLGREDRHAVLVGALVDAQRREVFSALFRATGEGEPGVVDEPAVGAPLAVLDRWSGLSDRQPIRFIGDGAIAYRELIAARFGPGVDIDDPAPPLAPAVARLGAHQAAQGLALAPHAVRPVYIRRPDAELARDRRRSTP